MKLIAALWGEKKCDQKLRLRLSPKACFISVMVHLSVRWESIVISAGFGRCNDKLTFTLDRVEAVSFSPPRDQSGYAAHGSGAARLC